MPYISQAQVNRMTNAEYKAFQAAAIARVNAEFGISDFVPPVANKSGGALLDGSSGAVAPGGTPDKACIPDGVTQNGEAVATPQSDNRASYTLRATQNGVAVVTQHSAVYLDKLLSHPCGAFRAQRGSFYGLCFATLHNSAERQA